MGRHFSGFRTARIGLGLAASVILGLPSCTEPERPSEAGAVASQVVVERPTEAPNLILISLDTVRADHMGVYGYGIANTPELDAFAAAATLYTQAYSTAPWTLPSHVSMLTGTLPIVHGAHTFRIEEPGRNVGPLDLEVTTLTEVLQRHGYRTGGFVANKHFLGKRFQVDQGFDTYHVFTGAGMATATEVNGKALAWLQGGAQEQPFFLFLNYMDAHRPYRSDERPGLFDFPVGKDSPRILSRLMEPILARDGKDHSEDLRQLRAQYDTGIANLDEDLGALLAALEARGDLDGTLIVITSDHGEYFGEHDLLEHSKDVYREGIHVPLMMKVPGQTTAARDERMISIAAIPALILPYLPEALAEAIAEEVRPSAVDAPVVAENYYSRSRDLFDRPWGDRFDRIRRALLADGYLYLHGSDGSRELYYLPDDPDQQHDLLEKDPARADAMMQQLEAQLTDAREAHLGDSPEYSEEEWRILDELGY